MGFVGQNQEGIKSGLCGILIESVNCIICDLLRYSIKKKKFDMTGQVKNND